MDLEKVGKTVLIVLVCIVLMFIIFIVAVTIDFYNDYKCSTTNSMEYWESHNCIKYCKECRDDYNR